MFQRISTTVATWILLSAVFVGIAFSMTYHRPSTVPLPEAQFDQLVANSPTLVDYVTYQSGSNEVIAYVHWVQEQPVADGYSEAWATPASASTAYSVIYTRPLTGEESLLKRLQAAHIKVEVHPYQPPVTAMVQVQHAIIEFWPLTAFALLFALALRYWANRTGFAQSAADDYEPGMYQDWNDGEQQHETNKSDTNGGGQKPDADGQKRQQQQNRDPNKQYMAHLKSKARIFDPTRGKKVTFADVAVEDVVIEKCMRIKNTLVHAHVFAMFNAYVPPGMLLVGPPGTGKTYLVKAIASECNFPVLMVTGSSFVEMFVGTGAARVADTWAQARKLRDARKSPVIIFIDEVDAVAGKRGHGSNDEREQALNQMLTEMDGANEDNRNIFVICATNLLEKLDPAFIRDGRMDEKVFVDLPDLALRKRIFQIHLAQTPCKDIDFDALARGCPGLSGAQIKSACNNAALRASARQLQLEARVKAPRPRVVPNPNGQGTITVPGRHGRLTAVTMHDLDEAISKVEMGDEREGRYKIMTADARKQTAVHESCHLAIVKKYRIYPVRKVTIMPRGGALGFIQGGEGEITFSQTREQMLAMIEMLLAGRYGQKVFLKTVDTGASNDFQRASQIARNMIMKYGMSDEIGDIVVEYDHQGRPIAGPRLLDRIDDEVSRILKECQAKAVEALRHDRLKIQRVARKLLERETLLGSEVDELWDASDEQPRGGVPQPVATHNG
jgi:cell division protease FtsH